MPIKYKINITSLKYNAMMNGIMGEWHFNNYTNTWKIDYSKLVYSLTFRHDFTYKMGNKSKDIFENSQLLMELNMDGEASLNPIPSFNDGYNPQEYLTGGDDPIKPKAQGGGGGDNPRYPGVKIVNVDSDRGHFNYRDLTIYVPIGMKDDYIQHEYGHYLQLLSMPFDCYKKCETQSFISGVKDWFRTIGIGNYSHRYFWFEVDANKRAIEKFGKDSELYKNSYWPR